MKGLFTSTIITLACSLSFSQDLSHKVMVSGASIFTSGNISYQQTVGEAVVELVLSDNKEFILTQGFQQPRILIPSILIPEGNGIEFFPNPVTEENDYALNVNFFSSDALPWSYEIIIANLIGAVIYKNQVNISIEDWYPWIVGDRVTYSFIYPIDLERFANGVFVINVTRSDGLIDRSFKILKL